MTLVARVIRQFHEGTEAVSLERLVALPSQPTMGTKLDLRAQGVEAALEVVAVTVRSLPAGPGFLKADVDLYLTPEPLASAELAREATSPSSSRRRSSWSSTSRPPKRSASQSRPRSWRAPTR